MANGQSSAPRSSTYSVISTASIPCSGKLAWNWRVLEWGLKNVSWGSAGGKTWVNHFTTGTATQDFNKMEAVGEAKYFVSKQADIRRFVYLPFHLRLILQFACRSAVCVSLHIAPDKMLDLWVLIGEPAQLRFVST